MLFGRRTFEEMRSFWPKQEADATGVTDFLNQVDKYVVSSTIGDPEWANSTVLSGELSDEITRLKSQPGKDIVCTGSIELCHALLAADLVDELRLYTHPVVQGRGRRLFPDDGGVERKARWLRTTVFGRGITFTSWSLR